MRICELRGHFSRFGCLFEVNFSWRRRRLEPLIRCVDFVAFWTWWWSLVCSDFFVGAVGRELYACGSFRCVLRENFVLASRSCLPSVLLRSALNLDVSADFVAGCGSRSALILTSQIS